jgi:5-methylcytosine-specific restriction enzyme B
MAIPTNINKEHLIKAIEKIDKEGIPIDSDSQYYDLVFNSKRYPPKVVVSFANLFANGEILDRNSFPGGIGTAAFKLLEENGFIITNKIMKINKALIKEIVNLCKVMSDGRQSGSITSLTYSEKFKPFLIKFKEKFGKSPNLHLQNELKTFYDIYLDKIDTKIDYKSFGFWGRSIYNYTWSCIYFDFKKDSLPASFSPQLYILVNREGIKFGFCYGQYINDEDEIVKSVLLENNLTLLKKCIQNDKELCFYNSEKEEVTASPEKLFGKRERIIVKTENDIINNWSSSSLLIKEYQNDNIPENISEIIQDTILNLKDFYISLLPIDKTKKEVNKIKLISQLPFDINRIKSQIKLSGLQLSDKFISRFVCSLLTKPFVILTGLSGSGKTKLAQAFAMWICENESQYCLVPVGADWTNREPLLGFPNALEYGKYIKPDNRVLDLIIEANANPAKPYFLILDEMNLSHVERYFADFLSVMESKGKIPLHQENGKFDDVPAEIGFSDNLFIIGTVNIDETTYMFSPKVLDRANVIEFRVNEGEMDDYLKTMKKLDLDILKSAGAGMAESFTQIATKETTEQRSIPEINSALLKFFKELKKAGAEYGYRSASEIMRFAVVVNKIEPAFSNTEIIDAAVMQKLLPKVHGSRKKLEDKLITLARLCVNEDELNSKDFKIENLLNTEDIESVTSKLLYPISFEKISRMYKGLITNGFTSYAEA